MGERLSAALPIRLEDLGVKTTCRELSSLRCFAFPACSHIHRFSSLGCSLHSGILTAYNASKQPQTAGSSLWVASTEAVAKETTAGGVCAMESPLLRDGLDSRFVRGRNGCLQRLWGCVGGHEGGIERGTGLSA